MFLFRRKVKHKWKSEKQEDRVGRVKSVTLGWALIDNIGASESASKKGIFLFCLFLIRM